MHPTQKQQIKRLEKKLKAYQKEAQRGAARALNDVTRKARKLTLQKVVAESGVKNKLLKNKIYFRRAKSNQLKTTLKSYLRPISAARMLTAAQLAKAPRGNNKRGVRVGGQQYNGAFINKVRGNTLVLQRKGKARLPVDVIRIKTQQSFTNNQLPISSRTMREDFARIYERELRYRASKYT